MNDIIRKESLNIWFCGKGFLKIYFNYNFNVDMIQIKSQKGVGSNEWMYCK